MNAATLLRKLERLERNVAELKVEVQKKSEKNPEKKTEKKPKTIEECKSKSDLKHFTVKDLKDWIKGNDSKNAKKLSEKVKDDLVNLIWKKIKGSKKAQSSSSESSSSDASTETESETDSDSSSDSD